MLTRLKVAKLIFMTLGVSSWSEKPPPVAKYANPSAVSITPELRSASPGFIVRVAFSVRSEFLTRRIDPGFVRVGQ